MEERAFMQTGTFAMVAHLQPLSVSKLRAARPPQKDGRSGVRPNFGRTPITLSFACKAIEMPLLDDRFSVLKEPSGVGCK